MTLKDTVNEMLSDDYKERFKAEYHQLKIRREGLEKMMKDWRNDKLNFKPTCPYSMYVGQLDYMKRYMDILVIRARKEGIEL